MFEFLFLFLFFIFFFLIGDQTTVCKTDHVVKVVEKCLSMPFYVFAKYE